MKLALTTIFAALGLSVASSQAVTLNLNTLGGTYPTYNDPSTGITITYNAGNPTRTTFAAEGGSPEVNGFSGDGGVLGGISTGPGGTFPEGLLILGPGDEVTITFATDNGAAMDFTFFDLDAGGSAFNNSSPIRDENITITQGANSVFVDGSPVSIFNTPGEVYNNRVNQGGFDQSAPITISLNGSLDTPANPNGFVGLGIGATVVVPEPSSILLSMLGLTLIGFRRRRS